MKTYAEFVEYLNLGHEIEFIYIDEEYSISHNNTWYFTKFSDPENCEIFESATFLIENILINNMNLIDIWNNIEIVTLY